MHPHRSILARFALASASVAFLGACAGEVAAPPPVVPAPPPPVAAPTPPAPVALATTPDDPMRASKPDALPNDPPFSPPVPVSRKLKNGAPVLVVENHAVPLVAVNVVITSGSDRNPLDRDGLSDFVTDMLLEGTTTRSSLDLAVARERLAAQLTTEAGPETIRVHLNALKETLPDALALLADVVQNPAFKPEDIERVRGLELTGLAAKKGNAGLLARDAFARAQFGEKNPWGLPAGGTPESIKAIDRKDLVRFHHDFFVPNNAVITVSGDVTVDEVTAALDKVLGGWKKGAVPARKTSPLPPEAARFIGFSDLPTATQSQVIVGWRAPKATSPDILPLQVANNVIGGLFTSRLNLNLREDKAYTYGARSRLALGRDVSSYAASAGVVAKHTADSVREFEKELARFKTDPIGDDELARAKEALIRSLPATLETNDAVADAMATLVQLGRPLDYYAKLPDQIRAVKKEDVVAEVKKYFEPERWPVIVVGPKAAALDALKALNLGEVKETAP